MAEKETTCIVDDCTKAPEHMGCCRRHYQALRKKSGVETPAVLNPQVPTQPLVDFAEARGWPALWGHADTITLYRADYICCEVLKVHPATIYGPVWFDWSHINPKVLEVWETPKAQHRPRLTPDQKAYINDRLGTVSMRMIAREGDLSYDAVVRYARRQRAA